LGLRRLCRGAIAGVQEHSRSRRVGESVLYVATRGVARQSVVRDGLPRRGVGNELAHARANPGIAVERPHANANRIGVGRIAAK